jgi:hypothetical protein
MAARWGQAIAIVVIIAMFGSCTTVPFSDKRLFNTFDQCITTNLLLAGVSGAGIGILVGKTTRQKGAAVGSGVAVATILALVAWHECAKIYSTTRVAAQRSRDDLVAAGQVAPEPVSTLAFEGLGARVDGDAKAVSFELGFIFISDARDEKDISVSIRHKLDVVRMIQRDDKLVLSDAAGKPLLDTNQRPILVKDSTSVPEGQIVYQTFYDKTDTEIIQQGSRKIVHELPAMVKGLQYPLPMRYTVSIDAGRFVGEQRLEFYLPDVPERPKAFVARDLAVITAKSGPPPGVLRSVTPPVTPPAPMSQVPSAETPLPQPPAATPRATEVATGGAERSALRYVTQKVVAVYESAGGSRQVGSLQSNTLLEVLDTVTVTLKDGRAAVWLKVASRQGVVGWLRKAEVAELR